MNERNINRPRDFSRVRGEIEVVMNAERVRESKAPCEIQCSGPTFIGNLNTLYNLIHHLLSSHVGVSQGMGLPISE